MISQSARATVPLFRPLFLFDSSESFPFGEDCRSPKGPGWLYTNEREKPVKHVGVTKLLWELTPVGGAFFLLATPKSHLLSLNQELSDVFSVSPEEVRMIVFHACGDVAPSD